jgi:hypothetical protein
MEGLPIIRMAVRRFAIPLMQCRFQNRVGGIRSCHRDAEGTAMKAATDLRGRHFLILSECMAVWVAPLDG